MCTTCRNDHISASRHLICFSSCWRLIHCLWYICVLHTFPLSSHLCVSTSLAHIPITRSLYHLSLLLCSSPLLSRFPPRSLLHSRSSFIICFLHIFYLCFRTWRSAFPSSFLPSIYLIKKKSPVSHWWLHMLWPSFCIQNGAFLSHPPRPLLHPASEPPSQVSLIPNESESESIH